ncbi:MAG: hypothetical protein KDK70_05310 [Myxococcales bacterium]|nr:hypothetical protein [Myxococcales bacterium]
MVPEAYHYELERGADDRVRVVLRGALEGSALPGLSDAFTALLRDLPARAGILIDLTEVTRCDPAACRTLARILRKVRDRGVRTAWLAHRARLRGAVWWIVHAAEDPRAMPVTDRRFAEDWLACDDERLDRLETQTREAYERVRSLLGRVSGTTGGR